MPKMPTGRPSTATKTAVRPLGGDLVAALPDRPELDALALQEAPVADGNAATVDRGDGTMTGNVVERLRFDHAGACLLGAMDDRLRERVLGRALDCRDQLQQLQFRDPIGDHVGDLGLALGQRSGLVHHDHFDPC